MNYIYLPPNEGNTRTINCSLRLNPRKNVFNGPFANVSLNLDRKFAGSIARCVANVPYDKRIDGKVVRYNHTGQAHKDFETKSCPRSCRTPNSRWSVSSPAFFASAGATFQS